LSRKPGRAMASLLSEFQARRNALLAALDANNLRGRLVKSAVGSQLIAFRFRLWRPLRKDVMEALNLASTLDYALRVSGVRVALEGGDIVIEVPRRGFTPVLAAPLRGRGLKVPLGRDVWLRPVLLDFASPSSPHALIVGASGAGKSELLAAIIFGLARQNSPERVRIALVDTRRAEPLARFGRLAHLAFRPARTPEEAASLCRWAVEELERRERNGATRPAIFLAIDEAFDVRARHKDVEELLMRLASGGRAKGIHLILATQRTTREALGSPLIQGNVLVRLVARVASSSDSFLATTVAKAGAERLLGRGDFLAVSPLGRVVRFQGALVRPRDVRELPSASPAPIPAQEPPAKPKRSWGGHNRVPDEELGPIVEYFLTDPGASILGAKRRFRRGDGPVYRAREIALRRLEHAGDG